MKRRPHASEAGTSGAALIHHPRSGSWGRLPRRFYAHLTSLRGKCTGPIQLNPTSSYLFTSPAQGVYFDFDPQTTMPQVSLLPSYPLRPPGMESRRTYLRVLHYEAASDLNVLVLIPLSSLHSKTKAKNPFFSFFLVFCSFFTPLDVVEINAKACFS